MLFASGCGSIESSSWYLPLPAPRSSTSTFSSPVVGVGADRWPAVLLPLQPHSLNWPGIIFFLAPKIVSR